MKSRVFSMERQDRNSASIEFAATSQTLMHKSHFQIYMRQRCTRVIPVWILGTSTHMYSWYIWYTECGLSVRMYTLICLHVYRSFWLAPAPARPPPGPGPAPDLRRQHRWPSYNRSAIAFCIALYCHQRQLRSGYIVNRLRKLRCFTMFAECGQQ